MPAPRDDHALLRAYVEMQDDEAFRELVARHADMVYASALRQVGRGGLAEDVTQATFILLARKAAAISSNTVVAAWLHKATRYSALNAMKIEQRRRIHERQAGEQAAAARQSPDAEPDWAESAALLDEGIARLGGRDREAVVLRFLERRSFSDVGRALGVSEEAAQMRVGRALEKLRSFFRRHGVTASVLTLRAAVNANAVVPASGAFKVALSPAVMRAVRGQSIPSTFATSIADAAGRSMEKAASRTVAMSISSGVAAVMVIGLLLCRSITHDPTPTATTAPHPPEAHMVAPSDLRSRALALATRHDGEDHPDRALWAMVWPMERVVTRR